MSSFRINKTYTTPKLVRVIENIGGTRICGTFIHLSDNSPYRTIFSCIEQCLARIDARCNLNRFVLDKTYNSTNKSFISTGINVDRTIAVLNCAAVSVTDNATNPLLITTNINGTRSQNAINQPTIRRLVRNKSPNRNLISTPEG